MAMDKKKIFSVLFLGLFTAGLLWSGQACLAEEELKLPSILPEGDISALVGQLIKYALGLVGVITLVMFIFGGITWMTSAGSADKVKKGKDTLIWAILGLALVFFSYAIVEFVLKALMNK